ncbi:glycosyltransferase family 2 protein [Methanobacterium formicicum]|uniref:Family 2 glycosyl transferase n=1 Tax=Methanobacterium formicicum (strain DSM 3637 / PP1) TaxID=1204725 RepID=K2R5J1_METFP|nr:glycosyltransferase family 2 protein [Methanobacterium formicicum]EKF86487.1 family 2 glycosyl transferase [Methanobacterium formicicum DSM 3637]
MKISIIINTFNEEKNIKNCLESVKWADEIIIVDMYSEDNTVDIARKYTDKIFFFKRMGYADPARQFALEKASNEWILVVDADELVPLKLVNKLHEIIEKDCGDVIYIPRNNYFAGKQIHNMGWGALDDLQPRFFKRKYLNFGEKIHDFYNINEDARIYKITDPHEGFIHFSYLDFEDYIDRLNKYTSIESKNIFENEEKQNQQKNIISLLFRLLNVFFSNYIRQKAYKDGFRGLSLSLLAVIYNLTVYLKLTLMEEYNTIDTREKVRDEYLKIVDKLLLEYTKK